MKLTVAAVTRKGYVKAKRGGKPAGSSWTYLRNNQTVLAVQWKSCVVFERTPAGRRIATVEEQDCVRHLARQRSNY